MKSIRMEHQDWNVVTLKKKNASKKTVGDPVIMKSQQLNKQNKSNVTAANIERKMEEDKFELPKVSHNLQLQMQQARQAKSWTQKQLAQASNLQESIVKSYESGKAVPSQ